MTSCDSNFADGPCPEEAARVFEIVTGDNDDFVFEVHLCRDCASSFVAQDGPIFVREAA